MILLASTLGFIVDYMMGWSNYSFLFTIGFSFLLVLIFGKKLFKREPKNKVASKKNHKKKESIFFERFEIWRYKIWSYIGCYLASSLIWGLLINLLKLFPEYTSGINIWYVSIIITTITMSVAGDLILKYWFKLQGILRILNYKEHLINQNNIRIYIYIVYLLLMFYVFAVGTDTNSQLWINCFATFVAFDRVKTNWKLIFDKNFKS